jgi:TPR repeat protein
MFESKAKIQRWADCGDDFFYGQDGEKVDYEMAVAFYEKAMKKKHPHATFMMGLCYELGRFVDKDLEYAEILYENAAEYGDKDAKKRLKDGKLSVPPVHSDEAEKPQKKKTVQARKPDLLSGDTGELDVKAVRQALEQKSQKEGSVDIKSPQELAPKAYNEGDYKKAYELYKVMAEKGSAESQFMMGLLCGGGKKSFCDDKAQAKVWFEKAASQGHQKAVAELKVIERVAAFMPMVENYAKEKAAKEAQELANGYYKQKNYKDAARFYKAAAEAGDVYSQYSLGFMYRHGQGVELNLDKAIEWLVKAADKGNESARKELVSIEQEIKEKEAKLEALRLAHAHFEAEDYMRAFPYLEKAAQDGEVWAQGNLGWMYGTGNGVPEDQKAALHWIEKAAQQGDMFAQFNLGMFYYNGHGGLSIDFEKAFYWYEKAAKQGHKDAPYELGISYWHSRGVKEDLYLAGYWFVQGKLRGNVECPNALNNLMEYLDTVAYVIEGWPAETIARIKQLKGY